MFPCISQHVLQLRRSRVLMIYCVINWYLISGLAGILYTDISSHSPVFYIDHSSRTTEKPNHFHKMAYSQTDINKFKACSSNKDRYDVLSYNDPKSAYPTFRNDLTTMYSETCL